MSGGAFLSIRVENPFKKFQGAAAKVFFTKKYRVFLILYPKILKLALNTLQCYIVTMLH